MERMIGSLTRDYARLPELRFPFVRVFEHDTCLCFGRIDVGVIA